MDELTGLPSLPELASALQEPAAGRGAIPAILIDVDSLRTLTAAFGPKVVDATLVRLAHWLLENTSAANGRAFRVHGDEFLLLLPRHTIPDANQLAAHLVSACTRLGLPDGHSTEALLTISAVVHEATAGLATEWPKRREGLLDALAKQGTQRGREVVAIMETPTKTPGQPWTVADLLLALSLTAGRSDAEVEAVARGVLASRPSDPHLHFLAARAQAKQQRWTEAASSARAAIAVHERYGPAWAILAEALQNLEDVKGSRAADDKAYLYWNPGRGYEHRLLSGHTKPVFDVAFAPDGDTIVTGSEDGTVRLWHLAPDRSRVLGQHEGPVHTVAFAPDGSLVATAGKDRCVRLWDAKSGELLRRIEQSDSVSVLAFSPDGQRLASGARDGTLWIGDPRNAEPSRVKHEAGSVTALAWIPGGGGIWVGRNDGRITYWDENNAAARPLEGLGQKTIGALALSPSGAWLAIAGHDKAIHLWDVATERPMPSLTGHTGLVSSLAFTRSGATLVSGGFDMSVRIWDLVLGRLHEVLPTKGAFIHAASVSPFGGDIAVGTDLPFVEVWSPRDHT